MEPKELNDNEFQRILWDESTGIIGIDWKEATSRMTDDDMKHELELFASYVERKRAPRILIDLTEFGYRMSPEVQQWWSENILPRYNVVEVKRFAFLFKPDTEITAAMNQSAPGALFLTRSFNSLKSAIDWLSGPE